MSQDVIPQTDVGNLSLRGLGAFSTLLGTLSADNVFPAAIWQMSNLGSSFPVSGEYAEQAKDLLQRCSDIRLDRLALVVGWRKNDSASLMAESAGGQAIALLSMCLISLYSKKETGLICFRLCSRLCPRSHNVSTPVQLADVADTVAGKVGMLGFGNLLAREVMKIHKAYLALDKQCPNDLLERLSSESAADLLEILSQALCHDGKVCRIIGSCGMGHVIGLLQALFSHDTFIVVEDVVIQDPGGNSRIHCEVLSGDASQPLRVHLETPILREKIITLPIAPWNPYLKTDKFPYSPNYCFKWSGWIADSLQLIFLDSGLQCSADILEACSNHVQIALRTLHLGKPGSQGLIHRDIEVLRPVDILGPSAKLSISSRCEILFKHAPVVSQISRFQSLENLIAQLERIPGIETCKCTNVERDWQKFFRPWEKTPKLYFSEEGESIIDPDFTTAKHTCKLSFLWGVVKAAVVLGLCAFFVQASPNTTIELLYPHLASQTCMDNLQRAIFQRESIFPVQINDLWDMIIALNPFFEDHRRKLIVSSTSSTLFPDILRSLEMPNYQCLSFSLVEGRLIHGQRYHGLLRAAGEQDRAKAKSSLTRDIAPSHIGNPSDLALVTIEELYDHLELHCSIVYAGVQVKLNMARVLIGYMATHWPAPCNHSMHGRLDTSKYKAMATTVATPAALKRHVGIVMTRGNAMAQLLSCDTQYFLVLQKGCCLNCILFQFKEINDNLVVMVT